MLGSPHVGKKNTSAAPSPAPLGARQPSTSIEHTAFLVHAAQLAVLKNEKSSKSSMLKRQELEHEHLSICGRSFAQRSVRAAQRAAQAPDLWHTRAALRDGAGPATLRAASAARKRYNQVFYFGAAAETSFWRRCRNELLVAISIGVGLSCARSALGATPGHARSALAGHTRGAC